MTASSPSDAEPHDIKDILGEDAISAELIGNVPPETRTELLRAIVAFQFEIEQIEQYSGAVPHPSLIERYEATLPGSADRILRMAEERQAANIDIEHQHSHNKHRIEIAAVNGFLWNERLGMFLVVGLALAIVLIGMRIMELGHSAEGFAVIVGAACGIGIAYMKSLGRGSDQGPQSDNS